MATLITDVTLQMRKWIDKKVNTGIYKNRSAAIRALIKEDMNKNKYPKAALSQKALEKIWGNKEDEIWNSYL